MVAMRSCEHLLICNNNTSVVLLVMVTFFRGLLVIQQNCHFIYETGGTWPDGELFLVRVGERPKAPLLGKGCISCAHRYSIGVRSKTPMLGRSKGLLGNIRLSPSNG